MVDFVKDFLRLAWVKNNSALFAFRMAADNSDLKSTLQIEMTSLLLQPLIK